MARRFLSITNFAEMFASAENCKSLHLSTCAEAALLGPIRRPAPGSRNGGVMRIGRALIIPAVLALSVAGSALVGSALPGAAANVPVVHGHAVALTTGTDVYHHA